MVAPVADEYVSFAHRLQAASPDSALKLPAGQAEHEPPCTAKPALHLHALLPGEPGEEREKSQRASQREERRNVGRKRGRQ